MQQRKAPGGYMLKKREIAGFMLTESLYPPGLEQPRHLHKPASLSVVLAGGYNETIEKKTRSCEPSTLILRPPHESHAVIYGSRKVRILNVEIDLPRLERIGESSFIFHNSAALQTQTMTWLGKRLHREFSLMDEASALATEGIVLEILAEALRQNRTNKVKSPLWLERAREFLHDNFTETVNLETISATVGVHPVHLARVFRQHYGCTVGEYVRRLRIEFACRQITTTDAPLNEIAFTAGFADQSHFVRIFKSRFGVAPSEYRKISRTR